MFSPFPDSKGDTSVANGGSAAGANEGDRCSEPLLWRRQQLGLLYIPVSIFPKAPNGRQAYPSKRSISLVLVIRSKLESLGVWVATGKKGNTLESGRSSPVLRDLHHGVHSFKASSAGPFETNSDWKWRPEAIASWEWFRQNQRYDELEQNPNNKDDYNGRNRQFQS